MATSALAAAISGAPPHGHLGSSVAVLGATATACEDTGLSDASNTRLAGINTRMVEGVAGLCANAAAHGVHVSVIINIFSGACSLDDLPPCVINVTHIPGSKLSFWTSALVPELTSAFDIVWCFDNDLAVDKFALHVAARAVLASRVSMAQPCIQGARRGRNTSMSTRTTDIPYLRCHHKCQSAVPRRGEDRFGRGIKCLLREMKFIEVMTPMFTANAWALNHRDILSHIPLPLMLESDRGLSEIWCGFFSAHLPEQPSCGLLCVPLTHYHGRTIDASNHSHVRYGANRSTRGTAAHLVKWSHDKWRPYYLKSAAGWPPMECRMPVNATRGALARAIPFVEQNAPLERPCGAGCQRRNRLTAW